MSLDIVTGSNLLYLKGVSFMELFLKSFMHEQNFPEDARECFLNLHNRIDKDKVIHDLVFLTVDRFFENDISFNDLDEFFKTCAFQAGTHEYTLAMLFFMYCARVLEKKYLQRGIDRKIYVDTMNDLKCKLMECREVYGINGTFVAHWYPQFFTLERFALGRLQYEKIPFPKEDYSKNGYTVRKGSIVYNCHIPSSGSLTEEMCFESYKKAYEFYKDELGDNPMVIVCHSWLLYPENVDFFPKHSNILKFMSHFDIISYDTHDSFSEAWRVFGKNGLLPPSEWKTETSLQRAFKKHVLSNGRTGNGYGVLIFDGENIVN
jgi:hypothetical protein